MLTNDLEAYYIFKDEPLRGTLLALRSLILDFDHEISEAYKWKIPFFIYKSSNFCYLNVNNKNDHPYLAMYNGRHIDHPLLTSGDRKMIKILEVDPEADLPYETIQEILQLGIYYQDSK